MENAFTFIKQSSEPTANWELVQIISHGTLNRIGTIINNQFQPLTSGSRTQAVWVNQGAITAISQPCGSNNQPIYINSNGNFTASSATIGSHKQAVWVNQGVITAMNQSCGNNTQPIYIDSNGNFTASSASIGNISVPLYIAAGAFMPCTDVMSRSSFTYNGGILTIQL